MIVASHPWLNFSNFLERRYIELYLSSLHWAFFSFNEIRTHYSSKIHTNYQWSHSLTVKNLDILHFCSFASDVISKTRANSAKLSAFSDLATPIYHKNAPTIWDKRQKYLFLPSVINWAYTDFVLLAKLSGKHTKSAVFQSTCYR